MVLVCQKTLLIPKFRRFIQRPKLTPIPLSPSDNVVVHHRSRTLLISANNYYPADPWISGVKNHGRPACYRLDWSR
jgi:hypothetical protein